ncbi:hypothetical protein H6G06_26805 [Anabaena sphaerica FACHB-251]|uniref:Uncharacterized protein n=1 Tax=Anabaena sphaerica FACHB-251 TaxID=2692883 RepID=A0A926WLR6_9NOST|nr:hypothetical protein [Anabaena sphaerica]MBD2296986.1 hypothetical protein [Anabaena sphaerica FACHB-251]
MLNKVATRIQSRLSRKGLKVVLGEIKEQCIKTFLDIDNPTKVEINAVTDYFMNNATKLTVITEKIEAVTINEAATEQETLTNNNSDEIEPETTTNPSTIEELSEFYTHPALFTPKTENEEIPQSSELATTTKNELVSSTAQNMGIALDTSEISLIAENINDSTDTLEQDIDAIKAAIMAFVEHKAMISQQKINNLITEVREVVNEKNTENSQLLTDGLKSINNDIQEANKQFKSNVKKALAAFTIPTSKAG